VTEGDEVVELPIDGRLDLHLFLPHEMKRLVNAYLDACREKGALDVEIVHGKGTGTLLRTVRSLLEARSDVVSFRLAEEARGGWGVTLARLAPLPQE
jgi:DNA-nicking Smr family endonuclease